MTGDNQNTTVVGQAASEGKHGILSISIKEVGVLYSAYMPFLENGGLFIPTRKQYELGDEVFVLLNLMDEPERIPLAGDCRMDHASQCPGQPRTRHRYPVQ